MCTSIVVNKNKTIVGWNLDILDMEFRDTSLDGLGQISYRKRHAGKSNG